MDNNSNEDKKVEYLQMIQEPIGRMSTTSAIFKGFSATLVVGMVTILDSKINIFSIISSIFFVIVFALLDTYYLSLERKFRLLFEEVRKGQHPIDFSMKPISEIDKLKTGKARFIDCLGSMSIWMFYLSLIMFLLITLLLKIHNIL